MRQGDPLSPLLFIIVIDKILELADPDIHLPVKGCPVDALAYADDLILPAPNVEDLQSKIDELIDTANLAGPSINLDKSHSIRLVTSKKKQLSAVAPVQFRVHDGIIDALGVGDVFRYLRIDFTPHGKAPVNSKTKLAELLENLRAAQLKPQQRMRLLTQHALPKLIHALCLGLVHQKTLQAMNRMTRFSIRKWLSLPPDTPVAYSHAPVCKGGLGVLYFASKISQLRWQHLNRLSTSSSSLLRWAAIATCVASLLKLATSTVSIGSHPDVLHEDSFDAWAA